jgi:hypothetical protein
MSVPIVHGPKHVVSVPSALKVSEMRILSIEYEGLL